MHTFTCYKDNIVSTFHSFHSWSHFQEYVALTCFKQIKKRVIKPCYFSLNLSIIPEEIEGFVSVHGSCIWYHLKGLEDVEESTHYSLNSVGTLHSKVTGYLVLLFCEIHIIFHELSSWEAMQTKFHEIRKFRPNYTKVRLERKFEVSSSRTRKPVVFHWRKISRN